jgi:hypothetical protein
LSEEELAPNAAGLSVDDEEEPIADGCGEGEEGKNLPELSDDSELDKSEDNQIEDDIPGLLVESDDENGNDVHPNNLEDDEASEQEFKSDAEGEEQVELESNSDRDREEKDLAANDEDGVVTQYYCEYFSNESDACHIGCQGQMEGFLCRFLERL